MNKLIILQGAPATGKSTWARQWVESVENCKSWIIINRDSIRESLGRYWVPSREPLVDVIEMDMAHAAAELDYNIVVDATNYNPKTLSRWKSFAKEFEMEIELRQFRAPLQECIKRDSLRERPVGEDVIKHFFEKYNL